MTSSGPSGLLMPPPRRMAAPPSAAQVESDRISEDLGARLLQGWAMLDVYCPRCGAGHWGGRSGSLSYGAYLHMKFALLDVF